MMEPNFAERLKQTIEQLYGEKQKSEESKETLSPEALEARRAYHREYAKKYYAKNPDKRKESNRKYWENRARKMAEGKGATTA